MAATLIESKKIWKNFLINKKPCEKRDPILNKPEPFNVFSIYRPGRPHPLFRGLVAAAQQRLPGSPSEAIANSQGVASTTPAA